MHRNLTPDRYRKSRSRMARQLTLATAERDAARHRLLEERKDHARELRQAHREITLLAQELDYYRDLIHYQLGGERSVASA